MAVDQVTYLNGAGDSLYFKLDQLLRDSKQGKASIAQWKASIKAFAQKGLKQIELDELCVMDILGSLGGDEVLPREALIGEFKSGQSAIEEVVRMLAESGQDAAPIRQWKATVKAFAQKGIKLGAPYVMDILDSLAEDKVFPRQALIDELQNKRHTITDAVLVLTESNESEASIKQWKALIDARGPRGSTLDRPYLTAVLDLLGEKRMLTREALVDELRSKQYTIKEVVLGSPRYTAWHQPGGKYFEFLYIANSERAMLQDALEQIEFDLEEIATFPEMLLQKGVSVTELLARREALMVKVPDAWEFGAHHFDEQIRGKHGKNLLAHCRVTVRGDIYFIEEIQSDWAQRGRRHNWNGIAQGPLVTSSEAWAGMVLRRHLQLAARNPSIKRVAWITESMRNGRGQDLEGEAAKEAQKQASRTFVAEETKRQLDAIPGYETLPPEQKKAALLQAQTTATQVAAGSGLHEPHDMLNDFYLTMLPKLADKVVSKAGGKVAMTELVLGDKTKEINRNRYDQESAGQNVLNRVKVPTLELTPAVRDALAMPQPVYSRARLLSGPIDLSARMEEIDAAMQCAKEMLGSIRNIRFAMHVYDVASGRKVAGRYFNNLVQASLHAADIVEATGHECFHFATEHLMTRHEVEMLKEEFGPRTELNYRVREQLKKRGDHEAVLECLKDPMEAAAYGYTLWTAGKISVLHAPLRGLFADILSMARDALRWLRREILEHGATTTDELFRALRDGELAARARAREAKAEQARSLNAGARTGEPSLDGAEHDTAVDAAIAEHDLYDDQRAATP